MIVDGKAIRSCLRNVIDLEGTDVITVEGLGMQINPRLIQEAYVLFGTIQCGFCTPVMIMATEPLLDNNFNPTLKDIKKALEAKIIRNRTYIKESLGMCDWACSISYSCSTPDHSGDPDIEARHFTAVTDIPGEALEEIGERIYNLQRLILLREGRKKPEADYPADYNFTEPLQSTMATGIMVPGPGDSAVDVTGNKFVKSRFTTMLKEYFRLRGWDEETGIPGADTLAGLGLYN